MSWIPAAAPVRSMLFAPASEPRKMTATDRFGADVVVLDLEDAVAVSRKSEARGLAAEHLASGGHPQPVAVRVNAIDSGWLEQDLASLRGVRVAAIVVPKVEADATIDRVRELIEPGTPVVALIETAAGVLAAADICRSGRPDLVVVGNGDLAADLGIPLTPHARELEHARSHVVLACRAAGLPAPVDGPFLDLHDHAALAEANAASKALGLQGRVVVHPPQIPVVHAGYGNDDDLAMQQRIVEEFETAQEQGLASIRVGELFIDYPMYHAARRRLAASTTPES